MSCTDKLLIKQISGTCWANAVMTSLFYSDHMKKLIKYHMKTWKNTKSLEIIKDIIFKQENHTKNDYIKFFDTFKPEILLKTLHLEDSKYFEHNPDVKSGYVSGAYIHKLLKYIGITNFHILDTFDNNLYYGQYNKTERIIKDNKIYKSFGKSTKTEVSKYFSENPEVLVIMTKKSSDKQFYPDYYLNKDNFELDTKIVYNNHVYVVDSMTMANYNQYLCHKGHEICGITCDNDRYVYNGWVARTIDTGISEKIFRKVPCSLMKHDWMDKNDKTKDSFCIDVAKCDLKYNKDKKEESKELCFSFGKGPRNYIYIREDLIKKSEKIKVILKPVIVKPVIVKPVVVKPPKKEINCPDGKILNPKTGRCIDINGKIGKLLV